MSKNQNPTIRYQALNKCFRNPGKKYFIEDLVEACNEALLDFNPRSSGIQKRQVQYDIKFLRDSRGYSAPIEAIKDGKRTYYRYSDLSFSINNQPLNEQEAQQLKESLLTLRRFKGMPQFEWVEELSLRLEKTFHLESEENIISFETNPYLTGIEYISELYNAIINNQVLKITYKSYKTNTETHPIIHPYHLKQYNNRWYLVGLNNEYQNINNVPLDRILKIQESKVDFIPNNDIDFDEYFEDVIGVTVSNDTPPQKVLLLVDADQKPYIISKPIHGSQKVKEENHAYAIIELEVQLNYELESVLLSFGEKIEVLEPISLRNNIAKRIHNMFNNYFNNTH